MDPIRPHLDDETEPVEDLSPAFLRPVVFERNALHADPPIAHVVHEAQQVGTEGTVGEVVLYEHTPARDASGLLEQLFVIAAVMQDVGQEHHVEGIVAVGDLDAVEELHRNEGVGACHHIDCHQLDVAAQPREV